jgi:hypothetical protein
MGILAPCVRLRLQYGSASTRDQDGLEWSADLCLWGLPSDTIVMSCSDRLPGNGCLDLFSAKSFSRRKENRSLILGCTNKLYALSTWQRK